MHAIATKLADTNRSTALSLVLLLLSSTIYCHYRSSQSLSNAVTVIIVVCHSYHSSLSPSQSSFVVVVVRCNFVNVVIRHRPLQFRPIPSIWSLLSTDIRLLPFIPVDASNSSNRMYYIHTYSIPYSSNHMYVFFKIVYRFFKINMYIYILSY